MSRKRTDQHSGHPIGVVARRTGIRPDVLRAWEKRYKAVDPFRSPTGRRLYSDEDVERLHLLRQAVEAGRRISDVAGLSSRELSELVREDVPPAKAGTAITGRHGNVMANQLMARCVKALEDLDSAAIEKALVDASLSLTKPQLRGQLLVPLIELIGNRWAEGTLRVANEHFATAVVKSFLQTLNGRPGTRGCGLTIVVTTPMGQLHELGALLVSDVAADLGWRVVYLGPNLPADEIAAAVKKSSANAVALSLVYPPGDTLTARELIRLRSLLGRHIPILAGGRAASSYADALASISASISPDLKSFQSNLDNIAY